jgi:hypothetical protein
VRSELDILPCLPPACLQRIRQLGAELDKQRQRAEGADQAAAGADQAAAALDSKAARVLQFQVRDIYGW